jgi:nucleoside-diphosphate-sugar epimerase
MHTVEPSASTKVLVSGANGYIAMWVVRTLLEQGYTVRGAVRSEEKGKRLREYFHPYGDMVEWVVVEDIMKVCFSCVLCTLF